MGIKRARMFDGHDRRWKTGKRLIREMFCSHTMSDAEYMQCQAFVLTVLCESDFPTDNAEHAIKFQHTIRMSFDGMVPWRQLKAKYDMDGRLPVFDVDHGAGECLIAFYRQWEENGVTRFTCATEWREFTVEFVGQMMAQVHWQRVRDHIATRRVGFYWWELPARHSTAERDHARACADHERLRDRSL